MYYSKPLPKVVRLIGVFTIIYFLGWEAFAGIFLYTIADVFDSIDREKEINKKLDYLLPYAGK